jgi:UDPglucose 6-dehydrogenase
MFYLREMGEQLLMNSISIIGSGRVGNAVGLGFEQFGNRVIFHDINERQVARLKKEGHDATSELKYAVSRSSASFVCAPTPSQGCIDLSHVISVKGIADVLKGKPGYHLVVIKSTVLPTTTERILIPLLAESGKKLGEEIGVCANPEFLTEVTSTWTDDRGYCRDFLTEDRIVIGEYDGKSGDTLAQLYQPVGRPIFRTDLKTAEMIKYASNCMLAAKISYWNEIFLICQKLGIDSQQVADVAALDPRIGKYGTIHGRSFGGKCLPKDLEAFISFAEEYHHPALLAAVKQINDYMAENYGVRE